MLKKSNRAVPLGPSVHNLARRLRDSHVKVSTIIARCASVDRNHDGVIHINDLEDILIDYLSADKVPRRDMIQLARLLQPAKATAEGAIEFDRLSDILTPVMEEIEAFSHHKESKDRKVPKNDKDEHWYDPVDNDQHPKTQHRKGSLGHFIEEVACPAEANNFQTLVYCMEKYEKLSGMRCIPTGDGFVIPLGPNLQGRVSFTVDGYH